MLSLAIFTAKYALHNTDRIFEHVSAVTGSAYLVILIHTSLGASLFFFPHGAAAQCGLWPPHSRGFRDHTHDAPQSVGLLSGRVISSSQRPLPVNTRHLQQTNIHSPGGIRAHEISRRAAVDLRLRPRGHWDRLSNFVVL
jgi:hypothetical protein